MRTILPASLLLTAAEHDAAFDAQLLADRVAVDAGRHGDRR